MVLAFLGGLGRVVAVQEAVAVGLLSFAQVWNGILSSMFIGHALRKWVPQMSYEAFPCRTAAKSDQSPKP